MSLPRSKTAEDRLRLALESTTLGTWEWDDAARRMNVDARYEALIGHAPRSFDGRLETFTSLVHREDYPALAAAAVGARETGEDFHHRFRVRRASDGEIRWLEVRGCWVREGDVRVGATGTALDVTDETNRAAALEQEAERMRAAVRGVGALVWELDVEQRRVVYDEVLPYLGYAPSEMPEDARARSELCHPDDRELVLANVERIASGTPVLSAHTFRTRAKDGSYRWFESKVEVVAWDRVGRPARAVGASVDITERKRLDAKVREQADVLDSILANMPVAVLLYDAQGSFVFSNAAMHRLLGYGPEELADPTLAERVYPDPAMREEAFAHARRADGSWLVCRPRAKDGRIVESAWCNAHLPDGRILAIGRDESIEAQLRHAQKVESLGVMAGGIAHDFNNMLVGVLANANMAKDHAAPGSELAMLLAEIEAAATRAANLTKQLVTYAGKGRLALEVVDLSRLVRDMKLLLESAAPKTCELILDLPERTPAVKADPEQLRQVAMSLVSNACDALEGRGGTVGVRVRTETLHKASVAGFVAGPCVVLEVTDDGVGMTSDVVARAFDPFFTTKFAGRGLGLAATLGIVRSHRGIVDIASKPGAGSTVSVYLPALVATERPSTTDLAPPSPRPRNVLVVDDELAVRETARRVLERRGVGVLVAADGREALRTIAQHAVQIGAVVIDLAMPRMGGTELVAELRQQNPALRVLLMSGHPPDAEAAAAQVGVTDAPFLQKPFDARELADAVLRLLEG